MRALATLSLLALLAACTAQVAPVPPDRPECAAPDEKQPTDGGLGGTGNDLPCPPPVE